MKLVPVPELKTKTLLETIKEEVIQKAMQEGNINVMKEQDDVLLAPLDTKISFDDFVQGTNV